MASALPVAKVAAVGVQLWPRRASGPKPGKERVATGATTSARARRPASWRNRTCDTCRLWPTNANDLTRCRRVCISVPVSEALRLSVPDPFIPRPDIHRSGAIPNPEWDSVSRRRFPTTHIPHHENHHVVAAASALLFSVVFVHRTLGRKCRDDFLGRLVRLGRGIRHHQVSR